MRKFQGIVLDKGKRQATFSYFSFWSEITLPKFSDDEKKFSLSSVRVKLLQKALQIQHFFFQGEMKKSISTIHFVFIAQTETERPDMKEAITALPLLVCLKK